MAIPVSSSLLLMSGPFHFLSRIPPGEQQNSADGQAGERISGHGHRTHRLQRSAPLSPQGPLTPASIVWPSLTEPLPNAEPGPLGSPLPGSEEFRASPTQRRLTHLGEALLAMALLMAGLTIYLGTWVISHRMTNRGEFCLRLPVPPVLAHQEGGFASENQLLKQHELGKTLIRELPAASEGQRLRMKAQLNGLVREIDRVCDLNIFYYSQETALLTLATGSATLMIICLVLLAPEGIQNISRGMRTVMFTAGVILGVSVNFLQLGQLSQNGERAQQIYRGQYALLQRFTSSLANQRIEEGIRRSSIPSQPLSTPLAVAQLITAIDTKRLSMADPRMELDGSLAEQTWSHLLKGEDGEQAPENGKGATEALRPPRTP
jgi:hypothetical protein